MNEIMQRSDDMKYKIVDKMNKREVKCDHDGWMDRCKLRGKCPKRSNALPEEKMKRGNIMLDYEHVQYQYTYEQRTKIIIIIIDQKRRTASFQIIEREVTKVSLYKG